MAEAEAARVNWAFVSAREDASRNDRLDGHGGTEATEAPACLSLPRSPLAPPPTPTTRARCLRLRVHLRGVPASPPSPTLPSSSSSHRSSCLASHCLSRRCHNVLPLVSYSGFILHSVSRNRERLREVLTCRSEPLWLKSRPSFSPSSAPSFVFFFFFPFLASYYVSLRIPFPRDRAPHFCSSSILP